jgi:hypothetical protein
VSCNKQCTLCRLLTASLYCVHAAHTCTHTTQALQQAQYQQACDLADEQAKLEGLQDDMQEDTVLPLDQQLEVVLLTLLFLRSTASAALTAVDAVRTLKLLSLAAAVVVKVVVASSKLTQLLVYLFRLSACWCSVCCVSSVCFWCIALDTAC